MSLFLSFKLLGALGVPLGHLRRPNLDLYIDWLIYWSIDSRFFSTVMYIGDVLHRGTAPHAYRFCTEDDIFSGILRAHNCVSENEADVCIG